MSEVAMERMIDALPAWVYNVRFNYVKLDSEKISFNNTLTMSNDRYTFYNARHRVTGTLFISSARNNQGNLVTGVEGLSSYSGVMHIMAWSWDELPGVAEQRLGITRPPTFKLSDYMCAEIQAKFALGMAAVYDINKGEYVARERLTFIELDEKHFYYNSLGRLSHVLNVQRAPTSIKVLDAAGEETSAIKAPSIDAFLSYVLNYANARIITPTALNYPTNTVTVAVPGIQGFDEIPIIEAGMSVYTELSAEMHMQTDEIGTVNEEGSLVGWITECDFILAPIPRITRIASLDTGKWQPTSLDESPIATAARYNGWILNNTYYNLNYPADVGLQQIMGHVDADYVYFWELQNSGDFNDIRALKSALLSYVNYLSAAVCRRLRVRLVYIHYIGALINLYEAQRGVGYVAPSTYGVHSSYPYASSVRSSYEAYITDVFNLARIDLGANDSGSALAAYYKAHIGGHNAAMAGAIPSNGPELAKLGTGAVGSASAKLKAVYEFTLRQLTARVDQALTDAFMRDASLSGTIELNDPAIAINPGDSVTLNFLDDTFMHLKAMGANIDASPDALNYSVQVKRPLI